MTGTGPHGEVQRRLAEMDERLRALQHELEADVGWDLRRPQAAAVPRPRRAPRIFPPRPAPAGSEAPGPPSEPRLSAPAIPPAPVAPPQPPAGPPPPPPAAPPAPAEQMAARLLAALRELLAGYEIALAQMTSAPGGPAVTLAAGPFAGMAMLEQFEHTLRELPQVAAVTRRGFEGHSRAIVEVQLRG